MATELKAELRKDTGTTKMIRLRAEGRLPGVIYKEGKPGTLVSVEEREFSRLLHAGVRVLGLKLSDRTAQALIKDIQYDALGERLLHVDFNELREGQKVRVKVSIVTKGMAKGVSEGGVVNVVHHDIEVNCLPTAIPNHIVVDLEPLTLGGALHISEIKFPEGVTPAGKLTDVIAICEKPVEEVAAAPAEGAAEPEVLTAKKEDPEAAAAAGGDKKAAAPAKKDEKKK
jgi:large subunit ribosomal protein L25